MNLDHQKIAFQFSRSATSYSGSAVLQHQVADELMNRLDLVAIEPETILDLGAGPMNRTMDFKKRFARSAAFSLDLSFNMLVSQRRRWRVLRKYRAICADAQNIPLADNSIDLIYSNLMLQWCDVNRVFKQCLRVLKPGGLFVFSSFGPDTLREIRSAWEGIDDMPHIHPFLDMHIYGDLLGQSGFSQTVMDCEHITLTYTEPKEALLDLKKIGAVNADSDRRKTLTGRKRFQQFLRNYETFRDQSGQIPATYEVVYGHSWAPQNKVSGTAKHHAIPVSHA